MIVFVVEDGGRVGEEARAWIRQFWPHKAEGPNGCKAAQSFWQGLSATVQTMITEQTTSAYMPPRRRVVPDPRMAPGQRVIAADVPAGAAGPRAMEQDQEYAPDGAAPAAAPAGAAHAQQDPPAPAGAGHGAGQGPAQPGVAPAPPGQNAAPVASARNDQAAPAGAGQPQRGAP